MLLFGLLAVACVALYWTAVHTSFFADDFLFLDQVRDRSLIESLQRPDPLSNFYRPISRQVFFWTVAGASNESAFVFHVVNLACYVGLLALLFVLVRRFIGAYAATFATAFMALHYTADVPIRWACGSQELLSVGGALATIDLHRRGRRWLAAAAMAFAALSKEVVLLTPAIAAFADHRPGERWLETAKRAWPLGVGVAIYAIVWVFAPHTRQAASTEVEIHPGSPIAAFVHLVQVTLGLEGRQGDLFRLPRVGPPILPLVLALAALWLAGAGRWRGFVPARSREAAPGGAREIAPADAATARRHAIATGVVWALLATVPVIAVAILWSAYYYLYAMCGVALALGAWLADKPRSWALVTLALLAWGSNSARHVDEFATPRDPWTAASHINKFYIERATRYCERYLEDLFRMKPDLPDGSTLFFAGLRGNIAFQVADGPLIRWAYRDTSLRAYYLNNFSREKASRGPLFFFVGKGDSLREMEGGDEVFARIAFGMIVNDWPPGAIDALELDLERHPERLRSREWLAWCRWAEGDVAGGVEALRAAGFTPDSGSAAEREQALALYQRDGRVDESIAMMETAVRRHALDPAAHALLADLYLVRDPDDYRGPIEAFATRVLAPNDALAWRRWAMVQAQRERWLETMRSFERYFALAGPAGEQDAEAQRWVAQIRAMLPGGDLNPEGLRE